MLYDVEVPSKLETQLSPQPSTVAWQTKKLAMSKLELGV